MFPFCIKRRLAIRNTHPRKPVTADSEAEPCRPEIILPVIREVVSAPVVADAQSRGGAIGDHKLPGRYNR
ncbi:MAG: hypothetical protein Fues2KO_12220 [Fuerstiella sp.]